MFNASVLPGLLLALLGFGCMPFSIETTHKGYAGRGYALFVVGILLLVVGVYYMDAVGLRK